MKKKVLIIGANSEIAFHLAKVLFKNNYSLILLSKNYIKLKRKVKLIQNKKRSLIKFKKFDISKKKEIKEIIKKYAQAEILVIACGFLNPKNRNDYRTLNINYSGPKFLLKELLKNKNSLKEIICFTSISGDRIDANFNKYSYSKKKLSSFILKHKFKMRLKNIYLKDLKLGYVKTKMTKHIFLRNLICKSPIKVADHIYKNIGIKNDNIIYYPKIWLIIIKIYNFIKKIQFKIHLKN